MNITYKATRACPALAREYGRTSANITVTAQAYLLGGNSHPHFSVTGEIWGKNRRDEISGGCIHDEIRKYFPNLEPLIRLHLSNADDGEPMHAVENGFYWLAGAVDGNFGQHFHGGNSKHHYPCKAPADKPWANTEYREPTQTECLDLLAEHLRISMDDAKAIRRQCVEAFKAGADSIAAGEEVTASAETARNKAGAKAAKATFAGYCDNLRAMWLKEAQDGVALIESLNGAVPA